MSVSSCFRTTFANKRVHRSQTLLEPALQHFYPNFPLIQDKVSPEKRLLIRLQVLGLFGNRFTADRMYSRRKWEKLSQQFQTLFSQKQKTFSLIFIAFLEFTQNFAHF